MKKLFTFFTMCLLMATMAMAETTIIFDASVDKGSLGSSNPGADQVVKDGVTVAVSNGCMNLTDQYRCYKNATMTVTSTVGNITKIEITCIASGEAQYGPGNFTVTEGTYTYQGNVGSWTGNAASTVFTTTGQVRMYKIVVTVGGGGEETVANPTFTPAAGTYYNPINVEIKSGTTGANIYYTLDGTTPSASSTAYTEAIAIIQNTTIKAIAIKGDKQSEVAEAAYVFEQGTQVASIAAYNALDDGTMVQFTIPVTALAQNGNNLYVTDGTDYALIYGSTSKTYKNGQSIPAGFIGKKTTYNGMPELTNPLSGFEAGVDGPAIDAEEIRCEDVSADLWAHYVVIKEATISVTNKTITDASGSAPIHTGMGGYGSSTDTTKVYDVYAVIGSYRPASATETVYQVLPYKLVPAGTTPTEGLTIAEFQQLADNTDTEAFNAVTTLAQSGSRLFVKDETGYMLIYGNVGKTYNTGDIIPAGFSGQKTSWDGEPELKNPKNFAESTESTTVTPVEANAAYLKHENFAHYVVFKNATISGLKIYDAAGAEVAFYCNMGANLPADETKTYDIYGIVGSRGATNTVYQLLPTEFKATDGSEEQIPEVADVEALYDLNKGINARIKSDLVAIYQHGNRLFVKNNDTYTLVYGTLTETFENGDIIRDAIASWSEYQGAKQLVPVDSTFVVAEKGAAIEPIEMPLEEMGQDMVHTYFLVKNATLTTTETENTYMVNDGTIDMKAFNQFGIEMPEDLEAQYDIKCFLTVYKQELELYPVEITKVGGEQPGKPGDVTGNGIVDIADVNAVIDMMLGKAENTLTDVNGDGVVDIFDVNEVVNAMLGKVVIPTTTYTVNGVSFKMVAVEGGTFTMGATTEQGSDAEDCEKPAHQVTLSSYSIGQTEVTQELWQAVMGDNPSRSHIDPQCPVEYVGWIDCQMFVDKLNELTGQTFRLPTEAEWEYAARGGNLSQGYKYAGSNTLADVAWYSYNSGSTTHPVSTKAPNELGLYDMSGNVREWCQDVCGIYSSDAQTNPTGPASYGGDDSCVCRGGHWNDYARDCRVSARGSDWMSPLKETPYDIGLRLAL